MVDLPCFFCTAREIVLDRVATAVHRLCCNGELIVTSLFLSITTDFVAVNRDLNIASHHVCDGHTLHLAIIGQLFLVQGDDSICDVELCDGECCICCLCNKALLALCAQCHAYIIGTCISRSSCQGIRLFGTVLFRGIISHDKSHIPIVCTCASVCLLLRVIGHCLRFGRDGNFTLIDIDGNSNFRRSPIQVIIATLHFIEHGIVANLFTCRNFFRPFFILRCWVIVTIECCWRIFGVVFDCDSFRHRGGSHQSHIRTSIFEVCFTYRSYPSIITPINCTFGNGEFKLPGAVIIALTSNADLVGAYIYRSLGGCTVFFVHRCCNAFLDLKVILDLIVCSFRQCYRVLRICGQRDTWLYSHSCIGVSLLASWQCMYEHITILAL